MKRIFLLLMLFCSSMLQAQTFINRAGQANTVQDARLATLYNFILPRYTDTTAANTTANIGTDSCGALIYIRSTGKIYKRLCSPKKWQEIFTETDPFFTISPAYYITDARITHWDSTYLWGNHAIAGYASTIALTDSITDLKSAIATKTNNSDTAAMMAAAPRVQRFLDSITNVKSSIATKTNNSDTAVMMAAAPRVQRFLDSIINIKTSIATKTNNSDTAAMMAAAPRVQRFLDSIINIKSSIATKTNNSDTAAMMAAAPRVQRFLDSVANIKTSISTKQNTLTLTTTGTSGAATLTGATLNVPQYSGSNIGNSDLTLSGPRTLTNNGNLLKILGGNINASVEYNALQVETPNTSDASIVTINLNSTSTTTPRNWKIRAIGGAAGGFDIFDQTSAYRPFEFINSTQKVKVYRDFGNQLNSFTLGTAGLTGLAAMWLYNPTPTISNYIVLSEGSNTLINHSGGGIGFRESNVDKMKLFPTTGNLVIGTMTDVATSLFTINSTTKGFLPPRMTTTQRLAISSPAESLEVYDLTLHKLYVWDGTIWQAAW